MKTLLFSSSVDASKYIAGAGIAKGIALRSIDYEANVYRFSLIFSDESVAPEVNGVNPSDLTPGSIVDEDNAAAHIRSVIAATR